MSNADDRRYLRAAVEGLKCMCAAQHLETLDALLADNAQLRDALEEIAKDTEETLLCEQAPTWAAGRARIALDAT